MRVLLITRNLPPLVGGMERLNWHMAGELAKVAEVRVIGPQGASGLAPRGVDVREASLKPLWRFLLAARTLARQEAVAWRPDVVLAGSGLTAPLARHAARPCGARAVAYVHGLDVAVPDRAYRALWLPSIRAMDRVIANSRATASLCLDAGVDPARLGIVHPGVEAPVKEIDDRSIARFRVDHGLDGRPLLLSVGRLSARKGLREFVTRALPRVAAAQPGIVLLVVGGAPAQALHAQAQTPDSIRMAAREARVEENVRFLGSISDGELEIAYRAADIHVFPVRDIPGDPEGFGMVAVEAAAHGLPTVAFATGGVVDAVAEGLSGRLVAPGDYGAFAEAIVHTLGRGSEMRAGCMAHARQFHWPAFGEGILGQLHQVAGLAAGGCVS